MAVTLAFAIRRPVPGSSMPRRTWRNLKWVKASLCGRLRMAHSSATPLVSRTAVQPGSATVCRPSRVSGIRVRLSNAKLAMVGTFQEFGSWSQSGEGVSSIDIGIADDGRRVSDADAERAGTFRSATAPSHSGHPTGGSRMAPAASESGILHASEDAGSFEEAVRSATTIAGLAGTGAFVRVGVSTSATKRLPPIATQASTER